MGTGPQSTHGFDLALTELLSESRHEFLVEAGSAVGLKLFASLPLRHASDDDVDAARVAVSSAAQERHLDTSDIHDLLLSNLEHPHWDEVAKRCLACANCTMVCPTCFCSTVKDVSDLTGHEVERRQTWDSCFTADHSYLHGGSVHASIKSRYRQWLTHKLATWIDQFGTSGCVGCGRCITWCPAAIDLTEEVRKLREETGPSKKSEKEKV
jgi:formate hydrogenlyase subunit 6/NADH:ubiquinone oxidoreductase subunit I